MKLKNVMLGIVAAPSPPGRAGPGATRAGQVAGGSRDGKITFRLPAPDAKQASVTGIGQRLGMQKNEQGIWTAATDPLKPDT